MEDLCFDAQQAAEKAVKAVLIQRRLPFPYVHDIGRLLHLAEEAGESVPPEVHEAEQLTRYAVVARYPGLAEPVTEEHYVAAIAQAEAVVRWAERIVMAHGSLPKSAGG